MYSRCFWSCSVAPSIRFCTSQYLARATHSTVEMTKRIPCTVQYWTCSSESVLLYPKVTQDQTTLPDSTVEYCSPSTGQRWRREARKTCSAIPNAVFGLKVLNECCGREKCWKNIVDCECFSGKSGPESNAALCISADHYAALCNSADHYAALCKQWWLMLHRASVLTIMLHCVTVMTNAALCISADHYAALCNSSDETK